MVVTPLRYVCHLDGWYVCLARALGPGWISLPRRRFCSWGVAVVFVECTPRLVGRRVAITLPRRLVKAGAVHVLEHPKSCPQAARGRSSVPMLGELYWCRRRGYTRSVFRCRGPMSSGPRGGYRLGVPSWRQVSRVYLDLARNVGYCVAPS